MAKLTLTTTSAGYALATTLNANNALIEAALENTLSRDGTSPNTMSVALDMNSQLINNLAVPVNDQSAATKKYVDDIVTGFTSSATFSAALPYDITGSWDFEALASFEAGLRIYDAVDGTDYVEHVHDGTNLVTTAANTTLWDITLPSGMRINTTNASGGLSVLGTGGGGGLTVGYDATSYVRFDHDNTDGTMAFAGTTDFNVSNSGINWKFAGGYFIAEQAAADTDIAAHGQLWVKNDTPNILKFTDDAGTDGDVAVQTNGSFTGTLTGCTTSPTETFYWNKTLMGNGQYKVDLWLDGTGGLFATSNTTGCSITGLPAALTPTTTRGYGTAILVDNNVTVIGTCQIAAAATTLIFSTGSPISSTGFTSSSTKGIQAGFHCTFFVD